MSHTRFVASQSLVWFASSGLQHDRSVNNESGSAAGGRAGAWPRCFLRLPTRLRPLEGAAGNISSAKVVMDAPQNVRMRILTRTTYRQTDEAC
jgi:hypothetical protein